ncbi:N-acetylmannosamine-6-phosphate 2-epimerase [Pannus brasiliensis]
MRLESLKSGLIVSCQAPVESPLHDPAIIAAMARACVDRGAIGIRVDTPSHVRATRQQNPDTPIIGLWKRYYEGYEVYITPRIDDALEIARSGADIIAIDATSRARPEGETIAGIIDRVHRETGKLIMADVDSIDNALAAAEAGADLVGTTLYGYTNETKHLQPPSFSFLAEMVEKIPVPVICEGGIATPEEARKALEIGAYTVVVGTAITGIDLKTSAFLRELVDRS